MSDLPLREALIFELSKPGRGAGSQYPPKVPGSAQVPASLRRSKPPALPAFPASSPQPLHGRATSSESPCPCFGKPMLPKSYRCPSDCLRISYTRRARSSAG